jgi:hypothetical protein
MLLGLGRSSHPVILTLAGAEAGGSRCQRRSRLSLLTQCNPVSTKNTKKLAKRGGGRLQSQLPLGDQRQRRMAEPGAELTVS